MDAAFFDDAHAVIDDAHLAALELEPVHLWESDPATLTLSGGLDLLAAVRAEQARLAEREIQVLVALAGSQASVRTVTIDDDEGPRSVDIADERIDLIAVASQRSAGSVRRRVHLARTLHGRLPGTRRLLAIGAISPEHADVMARTADGLPDSLLGELEHRVLARATSLTPGETGALARRVRARLDARGEEQRRREARRHIDVRIWAEDDGLACLQARLPLADAARVHAALDVRSRGVDAAPDASMGERRAQALVEGICGRTGAAESSVGVEIQVVVDLPTLAALGNEAASQALGPVLVGAGASAAEPLAAPALRDLLADPAVPLTLRRLVVDPFTGDLLDRGRQAYRVGDALRAFLVARDQVCGFTGCLRAAEHCDIDHVVPWGEGGGTDRANLLPLCRRHHLLKTHAGWEIVERRPDGAVVWRGPDRREYVSHPWRVSDPRCAERPSILRAGDP